METVLLCVGLGFVVMVLAVLLRDDWPFLTRPQVRVEGEVIRHDKTISDGDDAWRAIFAFTDEAGTQREVRDLMLFQNRRPDIGTRATLSYPKTPPTKRACVGRCCARCSTGCCCLWRRRWSGG